MRQLRLALLATFCLSLAGCELVGDIFQAGLVVGVIVVLLIVGVVGWLISKLRGGSRGGPPPPTA